MARQKIPQGIGLLTHPSIVLHNSSTMNTYFAHFLILLICAAVPVGILAVLLAQARRDLAQMRVMRDEARTAYRNIRDLYREIP